MNPHIKRARLIAVAVGCIAFWGSIAGLSAHAPMKSTALGPQPGRLLTQLVIPQGWNFFTRDPREADIFVYRKDAGQWRPALHWPNASSDNAFGFRRTGRAQGIEVGHVIASVEWDDIELCRGGVGTCVGRDETARTAVNPVPSASLCGELAIVMKEPVPWAWSETTSPAHAPAKTARIDVQCR